MAAAFAGFKGELGKVREGSEAALGGERACTFMFRDSPPHAPGQPSNGRKQLLSHPTCMTTMGKMLG